MFVVWELDSELPFIFRFHCQAGDIRFAEIESPIFARRGPHVTDRADRWTGAHESLSCEKLLSMTTDAGVMVWKVSDVGEVTLRRPACGQLVTCIAGQALVFFR